MNMKKPEYRFVKGVSGLFPKERGKINKEGRAKIIERWGGGGVIWPKSQPRLHGGATLWLLW
jgi:hypothetical protein